MELPVALTSLTIGTARFRVGTWQGVADAAYLAPVTEATTLGPAVLAAARDRLAQQGFRSVTTAAVTPAVRDRLVADGFGVSAELAALSRDLHSLDGLPDPRRRTRRVRRRDLGLVLRIDSGAFAPIWRLDAEGLHEARTATSHSRWRVNRGAPVAAYSITGRAGPQGYLQRLAVAADCQGRGLGTVLVADALTWLRRGGARTVLVNTARDNEPALGLYERCGFAIEPDPLAVLHRNLP